MAAKEFLSRNGVDFEIVDVLRDPQGIARLRQLGARSVPVVARGTDYVWAQNVRDLAQFLGMGDRLQTSLPPSELVRRWMAVLQAARRYTRQLPPQALAERVVPVRDRSVRMLILHAFCIADRFLDAVIDGWVHDPLDSEIGDSAPGFHEPAGILSYADRVISRLAHWQERFDARAAEAPIATVTGEQTVAGVLERCTWHSAQHVRQLQFVLERHGLAVDGPLTAAELGGLPLPERLFE